MVWDRAKRHLSSFIEIRAERAFKEYISDIARIITPDRLEKMALQGIRMEVVAPVLAQALPKLNFAVKPTAGREIHPGARYLLDLPYERLLGFIAEVAPDHAEVLHRHPVYGRQLVEEMKHLVIP